MNKNVELVKNKHGTWLDKMDIWIYDEITRYFREAGYSWKAAQEKADRILNVSLDPQLKDVRRSI